MRRLGYLIGIGDGKSLHFRSLRKAIKRYKEHHPRKTWATIGITQDTNTGYEMVGTMTINPWQSD